MNAPQFHEMILSARVEGLTQGRAEGRAEVAYVNKRDIDDAHDRGHSKGLVIGSVIGAFLLASGELALAVIFL